MGDQQLQVLNPQGGCFEDSFEENDDIATATPLGEGVSQQFGMCGDSDFFAIEVPATHSLIVNLNLTPTLSLDDVEFDGDLFLYSVDGTLIDQSELTGTQDNVLAFVAPEATTYVVQWHRRSRRMSHNTR